MKCPHCLVAFHEEWINLTTNNPQDYEKQFHFQYCHCADCKRTIVRFGTRPRDGTTDFAWQFIHPKSINRAPIPKEVTDIVLIQDYREACLVFIDSAKASAALSRRCLQYLLREKAGVQHSDLASEIQQAIDSNKLPAELTQHLDYVRQVGNFAAHPIKSKSTGEIVDVESEEAEWNLDVLEDLFDFYFVKPAIADRKKQALNKKLQDAGKPMIT